MLWAGQSGVRTQAQVGDFSLIQNVQINYEAHSASNSMVTGVLALGIKWTVCNADHPPPCMLGVNGASSLLLLYAFLAWTGATLSSNSVLVILL